MKIQLGTIDIDDNDRRALWWYDNDTELRAGHDIKTCPMATEKECKEFIITAGRLELESVSYQYECASEEHPD